MYFVLKSLKFIYIIPLYMFRTPLCPSSGELYILRGFKMSDDAFRLSHSTAFDCSIRPLLDLFHSWLYTFHLSRFSGDGLE